MQFERVSSFSVDGQKIVVVQIARLSPFFAILENSRMLV